MIAKVYPYEGGQEATITVPSSKSISHRAIILAALADEESHIRNLNENDDVLKTIQAFNQCNYFPHGDIRKDGEEYIIDAIPGIGYYYENGYNDPDLYSGPNGVVECGESGSTLRFLIPIMAQFGREVTFHGNGRLMERPLSVYQEIYENLPDGKFEINGDELTVKGKLVPGEYHVDGTISSQFVTGLLFVLPLLEGDSKIVIENGVESKSYIDLTMDMMRMVGVNTKWEGEDTIVIPGNQSYGRLDYTVPGDDSAGAFFAVAGLIQNRPITVIGMEHDSKQPDHAIVEFAKWFNGNVEEVEGGYCFDGGELYETRLDLSDCPDLAPILFVLASQADTESFFHGVKRLEYKESNRLEAMKHNLEKAGGKVRCSTDDKGFGGSVRILNPNMAKERFYFDGYHDHRIVMALAILATVLEEPTMITDAECVSKSYPTFWEDLMSTGVKVEFYD